MATLHDILQAGAEHHRRGNLTEAERLYRMVLQMQPTQINALHLLGVIAGQTGRYDEAIELIGRAIALNDQVGDFYNNLGVVFIFQGDWNRAGLAFQRGVQLNPNSPEAYNGLGSACRGVGKIADALANFDKALSLRPDMADALRNLTSILVEQGQPAAALPYGEKALAANPRSADGHLALARVHRALGRGADAEFHFRAALELQPDHLDANLALGAIHLERRQLEPAFKHFQQALQTNPNSPEANNNLGTIFRETGQCNVALSYFQQAIHLNPNYALAHNNLAAALNDQGRLEEALPHFRRAVSLSPADRLAHSNLLMALLYSPGNPLEELLYEARAWAQRHTADIPLLPEERWDKKPGRRLRVGYLGADFRAHPVGYFIDPVLAHHDKAQFEIFCYANLAAGDDWTDKLRAAADHWEEVLGLSDEALAQKIRGDKIDILVDLSGHAGQSRLLVCARRPAPVQVTCLGYMGTTGLPTMDYFFADRYVIPPDEQAFYSEKVLYLPDSFYCMAPPDFAIPVNDMPAETNGYVTFGCFNNLSKINQEVIQAWAMILTKVAGSRLFLKTRSLSDPASCQRIQQMFEHEGISADRLRLEGHAPCAELLAAYHEVDLGLDPFPYSGGVTTFESLWMGVPVVTWTRPGFVGHNGESTLASLKLEAWVARSQEEYVHKNVQFARHLDRLKKIRGALRGKVEQSPLCDGARFTRGLESLYRQVWKEWAER